MAGTGPAAHAWTPAQSGYVWSFPRDHWAREGYKTEWWYFTGHLRTVEKPLRRFGYQFAFFWIDLSQDTGRHRFSELVVRAAPLLAGFSRHPVPALHGALVLRERRSRGTSVGTAKASTSPWATPGGSFGFSLSTHPRRGSGAPIRRDRGLWWRGLVHSPVVFRIQHRHLPRHPVPRQSRLARRPRMPDVVFRPRRKPEYRSRSSEYRIRCRGLGTPSARLLRLPSHVLQARVP